jgi:hypothetical protein
VRPRSSSLSLVVLSLALLVLAGCATENFTRRQKIAFAALSTTLAVTSAADISTTFSTLDRCRTCGEANPVMRMFVQRGRHATYGAMAMIDLGTLWLSWRLAQTPGTLSQYRWLPLVESIALHSFASVHNDRIRGQGHQ